MGILKRSNQKEKEESVFGRLGKNQISYSLEAEQKQEDDALIDNLPLMGSTPPPTCSEKKVKRKDVQGFLSPQRKNSLVKSPQGKFKTVKGHSKTPQQSAKKTMLRNLFAKGSNSKAQRTLLHRLDGLESVPKAGLSRDTDDQSSSEGTTATDFFLLAPSEATLLAIEPSLPLNLFDDFDFIAQRSCKSDRASAEEKVPVKALFSDSFEKLMSGTVSSDLNSRMGQGEDNSKDFRQGDLITFISETAHEKGSDKENENRDTVNVLNELICFESSRCKPVTNYADETRKTNDSYHSLISSAVSQRMRMRANSSNGAREQESANIEDDDSLGELSMFTTTNEQQHQKGTSQNPSNDDEESSVVTTNIKNDDSLEELSIFTPTNEEEEKRILKNPIYDDEDSTVVTVKMSNRTMIPQSYTNKEHRPVISSRPFSMAEQKKKFDQAIKIYRDTLKMRVSEFQDLKAYHSAMITSATKMAKLMIATNQNDLAKKYIKIAKRHRTQTCNLSSSTSSSSDSDSSDYSSDGSSTSSSSYSASSSRSEESTS